MGWPGALLLLVCVRTMRPHIIDAFALACLVIAGGCFLAAFFGIIEAFVSAIFDHPKRRKT